MNHIRIISIFAACAAAGLILTSGCKVEGALKGPSGSSSTTSAQNEPPPPEQAPPAADPGSAGTAGGAGGPSCQYPDNHCLDADVVFAGDKAWERSYVYVDSVKMTAEPNASGEASFMSLRDGGELTTSHFYRTYRPDPSQLRVGQMVVMLNAKDRNGAYRGPEDKEEAHGGRWWLTRIISVAPLAQGGELIVAGGHRVRADAVRLIEGDEKETVVVNGAEDTHHLQAEHWIISDRKMPDKSYSYATVGAAIQAPSEQTKGDGHFIDLHDGHSVWTKHAWRTRPATKEDIKLGRHVFVRNAKDQDGNYRAPKDRVDAISSRWWIAKVTDDSELYKNSVTVAGKYRANLEALRVVAE